MSDHLLPFPWLDLVLILALIAINGVLSMSELAIVSSREARLKAMAKSGSRGARVALDLAAEPGRFLSTVQIGITLISILAGAFSGRQPRRAGCASGWRWLGIDPDTAETLGFGLVIVAHDLRQPGDRRAGPQAVRACARPSRSRRSWRGRWSCCRR